MKKAIIASTSTLHDGKYLEYLFPELEWLFQNCQKIIFIPFARPGGLTHDEYTDKVRTVFQKMNIEVQGLHEFDNPAKALKDAQGIFTGGGNTFLLVKQLHDLSLMPVLKKTIESGTPYLGTSAGSNICGVSMQTTNDMPIVYPSSFATMGIINFNLNPHYLDPDVNSKHMGETRATRIKEFHHLNATPVIGLREGSWLEVKGDNVILKGALTARVFRQNLEPIEVESGTYLEKIFN